MSNKFDLQEFLRPVPQDNTNYMTACEVHAEIVSGAQTAAQGLCQMAQGFKRMRDERLYEALGYMDFAEYCEKGTGISRSQVYNYIAIVEKLPLELVQSTGQIGIEKLKILSTLTEEQRYEVLESTNVEDTTVKVLKAKIKELKDDKEKTVDELKAQIREIKSRPIDVTQLPDYIKLKEELEDSKAQFDEAVRDAEGEQNALNEKIGELQQKLAEMESEQDVTQSEEYQELAKQIDELNEKLEDAARYREGMETSNEDLAEQIERLKKEIKERENQPVAHNEKDIEEIERLTAELAAAESKHDSSKQYFLLRMTVAEMDELTKIAKSDNKLSKFADIIKSAVMLYA